MNTTAATPASTEQVFHLSYRIDEGNRDSREWGDERGRLGRKMSAHRGMGLPVLCSPLHLVLVLWQG